MKFRFKMKPQEKNAVTNLKMCLLYRTAGKEGIFVRYFHDRQIERNNLNELSHIFKQEQQPVFVDNAYNPF